MRIANTHVTTLDEVTKLQIKSRRIWVGITDPISPHRTLDADAQAALLVWSQLVVSTPFSLSMLPIELNAAADETLLVWVVLLSFLMAQLSGIKFRFLFQKRSHIGIGWVMICKSILLLGSFSHNTRLRFAFLHMSHAIVALCPVIKPLTTVLLTLPHPKDYL